MKQEKNQVLNEELDAYDLQCVSGGATRITHPWWNNGGAGGAGGSGGTGGTKGSLLIPYPLPIIPSLPGLPILF